MQRERWSKILQSDYGGIPDRAPGMPILQSHGNLVSRGDLITQENIVSTPGVWTLTINKDTYASLCQQATSWEQVGYSSAYVIEGSVATDSDGIYASAYGSNSSTWHGPLFYTTLPTEIGKSGQYWHTILKVKATFTSETRILAETTFGYSSSLGYYDYKSSDGVYIVSFLRNTGNHVMNREITTHPAVGSTNTYTLKLYHYANNTFKTYINGTLYKNQSDPFVLDKGSNIAFCYIMKCGTYPTAYIRVQEPTVSTDPSYDPQP